MKPNPPVPGTTPIDIAALIDNSKIGAFQIGLFALCGLCLIIDGFDVQAMGYAAPAILQDWKIDKASLGPVFGAGLFGMLIGSLVFSPVADRIGRRPVLIGATVFFGVCMLATAHVGTIDGLLALRFITGIGLGCIMPNAMALAGEFSPSRNKASTMMIVSCGFTLGAIVGGLVSAMLIPTFGWRAVFHAGGIAPLVIAAFMIFYLPESLQFLALRGGREERITASLKRIVPDLRFDGDVRYAMHEQVSKGIPIAHLFQDGRAIGTLLLWAINFMNLINLYFLSNWLPTLINDAGHATTYAVLAGTTLQVGGAIGTLALGWIIDRKGFVPVLVVSFLLATFAIAAIGQLAATLIPVFVVIFIAGFCIVGGQPAVNALAASYYPTSLRSTGIGWSLGVGRVGSIIGPVLGGALIGMHWSSASLFLAAAVPAAISALLMLGMRSATAR
ncbi:MFS transporter [Luteimonas panaciterrae]|uniref:MFS transporter n=1 Tax=Luteimonas panaciterrae TaxID=363885 RepID=UPI001CFA691D|nr:MFS transporter [Luteimonas panaciterrae]